MYRVVLVGIREGVARAEAVRDLAALFRTTPDRVEKILGSPYFPLKTGITKEVAMKYKAAIEAAGGACSVESDDQSDEIKVDLPPPAAAPAAVIGSTTEELKQPVGSADQASTNRPTASQSAISVIFFALAAYFIVPVLGPQLPLVGQWIAKAQEPDAPLEQLTRLGQTRRDDLARFNDAGGLDRNPSWYGFHIAHANFIWDQGDRLKTVQLRVDGKSVWLNSIGEWSREKSVSPRELREQLSNFVGATDHDWMINDVGGSLSKNGPHGKITCLYRTDERSGISVLIGLEPAETQSIAHSDSAVSAIHDPRPTSVPTQTGSGSQMMDRYLALHDAKNPREWGEEDMLTAIEILSHPETDADRKALQDQESAMQQDGNCATASCMTTRIEFEAARELRAGRAKSARQAMGLAALH